MRNKNSGVLINASVKPVQAMLAPTRLPAGRSAWFAILVLPLLIGATTTALAQNAKKADDSSDPSHHRAIAPHARSQEAREQTPHARHTIAPSHIGRPNTSRASHVDAGHVKHTNSDAGHHSSNHLRARPEHHVAVGAKTGAEKHISHTAAADGHHVRKAHAASNGHARSEPRRGVRSKTANAAAHKPARHAALSHKGGKDDKASRNR